MLPRSYEALAYVLPTQIVANYILSSTVPDSCISNAHAAWAHPAKDNPGDDREVSRTNHIAARLMRRTTQDMPTAGQYMNHEENIT
jgi:hypothetical protein